MPKIVPICPYLGANRPNLSYFSTNRCKFTFFFVNFSQFFYFVFLLDIFVNIKRLCPIVAQNYINVLELLRNSRF